MTWKVVTALRRNHLWFKDQEMYLILSVNTSITALMYVSLERSRLILYDKNKKWLHLILWNEGSNKLVYKHIHCSWPITE
jgi:hypothetical protein